MTTVRGTEDLAGLYAAAEPDFERYEVIKDLIDECIDLTLDHRQSGHPGGSRSKVHMMVSLCLSGAMRWDLRRPWLPFADRFVLSAGHTAPLVYATLAVLNEGLRARHQLDGDPRFAFPDDGRWALTWQHLLAFRQARGLAGHAEMAGPGLFLKFNTGPSGHGMPPSAGEALALVRAGAGEVKVFVVEGEGGLTAGASHETKLSAWGLGLHNLVFLVDWNDFGIDPRPASSFVPGTPVDWFAPYGWRVVGAEDGMSWGPMAHAVLEAARGDNPDRRPTVAWFRTRKGRGYGKFDAASHGSPWPPHSPEFWTNRKEFMGRHGVSYARVDQPALAGTAEQRAELAENLQTALSVLRRDHDLVRWLSDRLLAVADTVPERPAGLRLRPGSAAIFSDKRIFDVASYPEQMWKAPGEKAPNRSALAAWGSYVNSIGRQHYDRPLFIACSADLAESTNIIGFAKGWGDVPGWDWYQRDANPTGALLPTEITEFTNSGMTVGLATVNMAEDPFADFDGFWGACSTYGSFSYLKYGLMRLFSQLAQDCELRVGKVLWVAGHSGPETAEDSRTHFGIFAPGVTQLFPRDLVIDLHPWEYNEVPVVLGTAFGLDAPIVALHLTRPTVEIPDRAALGIPSHLAAAKGAYVVREPRADQPFGGTVFLRGTVPTANLVSVLPQLDGARLNVKIVQAVSPQLFRRQPAEYRQRVRSLADRLDAMVITNGAFQLMRDWADGELVREYSLSADWDDRWRTGGSVAEVMDEAHLSADHILTGIERFVADRPRRLAAVAEAADAARSR